MLLVLCVLCQAVDKSSLVRALCRCRDHVAGARLAASLASDYGLRDPHVCLVV